MRGWRVRGWRVREWRVRACERVACARVARQRVACERVACERVMLGQWPRAYVCAGVCARGADSFSALGAGPHAPHELTWHMPSCSSRTHLAHALMLLTNSPGTCPHATCEFTLPVHACSPRTQRTDIAGEVAYWAAYTLHLNLTPYTLHPTPYTLHPTPYTLHSTPYTLNPTP